MLHQSSIKLTQSGKGQACYALKSVSYTLILFYTKTTIENMNNEIANFVILLIHLNQTSITIFHLMVWKKLHFDLPIFALMTDSLFLSKSTHTKPLLLKNKVFKIITTVYDYKSIFEFFK